MTETIDIGPCDCCGGDGCTGNCVWHWIYDESSMLFYWQSEGICASPGGPVRCACDPPDYPGSEPNEEAITPCVAVA